MTSSAVLCAIETSTMGAIPIWRNSKDATFAKSCDNFNERTARRDVVRFDP